MSNEQEDTKLQAGMAASLVSSMIPEEASFALIVSDAEGETTIHSNMRPDFLLEALAQAQKNLNHRQSEIARKLDEYNS